MPDAVDLGLAIAHTAVLKWKLGRKGVGSYVWRIVWNLIRAAARNKFGQKSGGLGNTVNAETKTTRKSQRLL